MAAAGCFTIRSANWVSGALPFTINRLAAAVAALSLNVAAYLAETLRSGIESIDLGQWEAADALGFSALDRMRFVIAPQAIRRVLPPLANEFVTLIKDTCPLPCDRLR